MKYYPNAPTFDTVHVAIREDGYLWEIFINRPQARNAVDRGTAHALAILFRAFEEDSKARVAILGGIGSHFCAGADLKAVAQGNPNDVYPVGEAEGPMGPTRMKLTKPVIAAIQGSCVAGGLELACWADLRVVGTGSQLGVLCRRWGVPLIDGGTFRLPKLIGQSHALDLILTGRMISAEEAYRMGLANRLVDDDNVQYEARELAKHLIDFPQLCLKNDRKSLYETFDQSIQEALCTEYEFGTESMKKAPMGAAEFARGQGRHGGKRSERSKECVSSSSPSDITAVIFDLGGVLLESPFRAIDHFEEEHGLEPRSIARVIGHNEDTGSFARLERGEIASDNFAEQFSRECEEFGIGRVDGKRFLDTITLSLERRPLMEHAVGILREQGYKTGIITNNYKVTDTVDKDCIEQLMSELHKRMDVVMESCLYGRKKPDPSIYEAAIKKIEVPAHRIVYLDDIGANLKPASALGMKTIKVDHSDYGGIAAIGKLERLLGVPLLSNAVKMLSRRIPKL